MFLIQKGDQDPKFVRKRLKWEYKIRTEDTAFDKKRLEIEHETENHKRKFSAAQVEITLLEKELKSKTMKLELIQREINNFSSSWY